MITVIGGSGMLGGYLCRDLRAAGLPVRVMTRKPENAGKLAKMGVTLVRGDLREPDSLDAALANTRVVISASHAILGGRANSSEKVDGAGQRALIDAAKRSGVAHFIFVSAVGAAPDHAVDFWRTKWGTEQYLRASGLPYTIVRPTAFIDFHAYELIGKAVLQNKSVAITGTGNNLRNFVAVEDVARIIVQQVQSGEARGDTIEIGARQNMSSLQVAHAFESFAGRKARTMHLPLALLRLLSPVIGVFHPGVGRILRAAVISETTDQTFRASASQEAVPLMTLEQWIRKNCEV